MPDVQEVFRLATQKVRPDPGALERQQRQQRRSTTRRKMGAYAVAAALIAAIAVVAVRAGIGSSEPSDVGTQPSGPSVVPGAEPAFTVTSDGTTCSMDVTTDSIEPGFVLFDVVNDTDARAMFDSWLLSDGYSFRAFERAVRRDARFAEEGKTQGAWPGDDEVTYLRSDVIPAHSSETIAVPMAAGSHAITCLKPFDGLGIRPFGIAGPITVR
jgi:hypothetical protein